MRIAVVGAGPCGLLTARRLLEHGYKYDVFEQAKTLGGTWVYTDRIGPDENGLQSTCMYENLVTNVPKELMTCPGFPFSEDKLESYINQSEVLQYYDSFAEAFNLKKYIQFCTRVIKILPCGDKWIVTTQNVCTKHVVSQQFEYVFICNGRFSSPFIPKIPGDYLFKGVKMHSCDYKKPVKCFQGKRVLIIGGKQSGQDLVWRILKIAEHVFLSTRESDYIDEHKKLTLKPEVQQITEDSAVFDDETTELIDIILYCTGYLYVCPFLNNECGVKAENNGPAPLYKQIINIAHPTMYFIGIPYVTSGIPVFDLQVRFAVQAMEKKFQLPSKVDMLKEFEDFISNKSKNNVPNKHIYRLSTSVESKAYCQELSEKAGIETVPVVLFNLFDKVRFESSRTSCYRIVDDNTFIEIDSK
ncbi:hypothetical protein RN001_000561 [Aquatica leii]|uniref:Flavin-containing monooxygenase n=1 Tax=Aquatica leii TaxID=1421715 RepID=A0AAN7PA60_9COLE|nr:hypothetical protein RN001_000561 [Aquatica leii]